MSQPPPVTARSGGFVYRARQVQLVFAVLFVTVVVLQVFFAGLGVLVSPEYFGLHSSFGHLVSLPIFGLLITGLLGRSGWRSLGLSAALFFLYGLQYAFVEGAVGAVRALHAVNALVMFGLALRLTARAWAGVRAAAPARSAQGGRSFGRLLAGGVLVLAGAVVLFGAIVGDGPGRVGRAFLSEEGRARAVSAGPEVPGGALYAQHCSGCHGASGEGRVGPALAGNGVLADTPEVVRQVLEGGGGMPGFGGLSDEEVAAVVTLVRSSWGNDFGPVTAEDVTARR